MIEHEGKTWDVHELFSRMRQTAFATIESERISLRMPEYIPPVVIAADAERWIGLAGQLIQTWGAPNAKISVTSHFEDRTDPTYASVVLSIVAYRTTADCLEEVECDWLEDIGMLRDELLVRSVALAVHASGNSLVFDFRMPVHRYGTRRRVRRDAILLVEDDSHVLRAGKEVLELNGYRVLAESSAEAALGVCETRRDSICLVISDVTLPKQNGRQLADAVHASMPDVPVLLISGYSERDYEDPRRRIYFLAKPFNSTALLDAAKRCLSARQTAFSKGSNLPESQEVVTAWC